jgi:CRISPR-associated endonuclease/helicase Cas3
MMLSGNELGNHAWSDARHGLLTALAEALHLPGEPAPRAPSDDDHAFFMLLAGLTSVADWVGSAQDFFPFAGGDVDLAVYPKLAAVRAKTALKQLGWTGWRGNTSPTTFPQLFGFPPRPLQEKAVALAASTTGPGLVVIEAPMGEGKTEAALFLSDYWNSTLGQSGLYVALPTQATSNQMFSRVKDFLANRYSAETVNLHLLHGQALLSDNYQQLRLAAVYDEPASQGTPGRVVAEGWFTPKKRGLLAPFAVGTIDQVLLAVLQTRHVFVRLFGLANKTILLDEVHAYDTYMSTLLERLVSWMAALGCSVVLLSATLPRARRQRLLTAFGASESVIPETPYPRLLSVGDGKVTAISIPAARRMSIALSWVEAAALAAPLKDALRGGGCAAVICNTVGRAQEMYESLRTALEPEGIPVLLFHARFPFGQRDRLEKAILDRFGKAGDRPYRAVLLATQVIEQSLDLDFDLLVTELAPVDLVLQRAGRLHRHSNRLRPASLNEAQLWLIQPDEFDEHGVAHFGKNEYVYDRHILLRSYLYSGRGRVRHLH